MESDFVVTVRGLEEALANAVGEVVCAAVAQLEESFALDLRRLHRVVVATDYNTALAELSAFTVTGHPIEYTNEDYARGFAKVLTLPNSGQPEVVVVLDARLGSLLVAVREGPGSDDFRLGLHLMHHELCHVHDANRKVDAFGDAMFQRRGDHKYGVVLPLGVACWDEYSANRRCAATASRDALSMMAGNLDDAIVRTKPTVDGCILDYRIHADLDRLMSEFDRHGGFLLRAASYVLGYMDGLAVSLEELSPSTYSSLAGSYFETTFLGLSDVLRDFGALGESEWKSLDVFDVFGDFVDDYYEAMGLKLQRLGDGSLYVNVPFRPETTPDP